MSAGVAGQAPTAASACLKEAYRSKTWADRADPAQPGWAAQVAKVCSVSAIEPGTAVQHTKRRDMQGRVRKVRGPRALVTWVWRGLPSYARLENLTPISDDELARLVEEHDQLKAQWAQETEGGPYPVSPPTPMRPENRAFLLNLHTASAVDAARERAWPELTNGCEA